MPGNDELQELESSFSAIALQLFASATVEAMLQRIVDLAANSVDGCDAAGILVRDTSRDVWTTAVATTPAVVALDRLQLDLDEGPCLDASRQSRVFYAEDLADDPRWKAFGPAAVANDIRSMLAYPLSDEPGSAALNLYARLPLAFGVTGRAQGALFATLARLALDSAEERAADKRRAGNLTDALRTRELIGQAQGILMERERITADQAFAVLRRASQHTNVKLREVAESLVQTGESPETDGPPHAGD